LHDRRSTSFGSIWKKSKKIQGKAWNKVCQQEGIVCYLWILGRETEIRNQKEFRLNLKDGLVEEFHHFSEKFIFLTINKK